MDNPEKILIALLRSGIYGTEPKLLNPITEVEWREVYELASRQGVLTLTGVALLKVPKDLLPPKMLLLEWIGQVSLQENIYAQQRERVRELRELWCKAGIKCVELKGESVGRWYKTPSSRYSCDFDCFLSDYEKGNSIIEQQGININEDFYKNSSFYWKDLYVENHKFCTPIRGKMKLKILERKLQQFLSDFPEYPNEDFNALFLMEHAWSHFFEHAITMKHVCDWAVFRKSCGNGVDWESYEKTAKDCGFWKFSLAFNRITDVLDGLISEELLTLDEQKLLQSVLKTERMGGLNNGWTTRLSLFKSYFKHSWKYSAFSDHSMIYTLCRSICAFFFDRHPHL